MKKQLFTFLLVFLSFQKTVCAQAKEMAFIHGGKFIPLYGEKLTPVTVKDFKMDIYPVTNKEFKNFVKEYPKWQKSKALKLFTDKMYLSNWKNDVQLKDTERYNSPITYVSWYAAKDYCECQNKRLPTLNEWEYVAMADSTTKDARTKPSYNKQILSWYETPNTSQNTIGKHPKNIWGVYDLHGLVWEWTLDFNSVLINNTTKNENDGPNAFCGSAAINATDLMNYAAFMRYAIRGSLKASYSMKNLGFRCVKNISKKER